MSHHVLSALMPRDHMRSVPCRKPLLILASDSMAGGEDIMTYGLKKEGMVKKSCWDWKIYLHLSKDDR